MKIHLLPLFLIVAALAGCGGGDDVAPVAAAPEAPATPDAPAGPVGVPDNTVPPPAAPTGLAVASGAKRFDFTWDAVPGATTYRLLEDLDGAGPGAAAPVGPSVTTVAASYVPNALLHTRMNAQYRVQACNADGCGAASLPVTPNLNAAIGYFKASNTGAFDNFGWATALSADGSTLAVGARYEASNAAGVNGDQANNSIPGAGAVYIFVRAADGTWTQQAYLKVTVSQIDAHFGRSLALSSDGNILAAAAWRDANDQGAVHVFARDATGSWAHRAHLLASNGEPGDTFGTEVSLSGDGTVLAAGAMGEASSATGVGGNEADNSAPSAGAVYIFRNTAGTWAQEAYVKASHASTGGQFGYALALSTDGSTLAVGAPSEAGDTGAAYIFTRPAGAWVQQARLTASNAEADDRFGTAMALSADGSTFAVGAAFEDSGATTVNGDQADNSALTAGAAYVFTRAGTAWSQQAYLKAPNAGADDWFGRAIALSADGNTLAVGAPYDDSAGAGLGADPANNGSARSGAVHVFNRAAGLWTHAAYLKPTNPLTDGNVGFHGVSMSADGTSLAVGGFGDRSNATGVQGNQANTSMPSAGAVYLY